MLTPVLSDTAQQVALAVRMLERARHKPIITKDFEQSESLHYPSVSKPYDEHSAFFVPIDVRVLISTPRLRYFVCNAGYLYKLYVWCRSSNDPASPNLWVSTDTFVHLDNYRRSNAAVVIASRLSQLTDRLAVVYSELQPLESLLSLTD